jgi:hypothetical protein
MTKASYFTLQNQISDFHHRLLGALILISAPVKIGQRLVLSNIRTKVLVECIVAHKGEHRDGRLEVGVQFGLPHPTFWGVTFPPSDWSSQHPDSKPRS